MSPDKLQKLKDLTDKLANTVIFDADPENWVGAGVPAKDLSKDDRGDAYWCRKVAAASLSVLMKVYNLAQHVEHRMGSMPENEDTPEEDKSLDAEINAAEKEAAAILAKVQKAAHAKRKQT